MFEEFDEYVFGFAGEDFAVDYWYDEGFDIAENMLCEFKESDWKMLLEALSERTVEWQKVLLILAETDDTELFEIVVDSLRAFTSEECLNLIQADPKIVAKIEELMPKAGNVTKRIFEEFLRIKDMGLEGKGQKN